jgi:hypothetical protein
MRNKIYKFFLLLFIFATVSIGTALADDPNPQPPPDPGGDPTGGGNGPVGSEPAPIGGGMEILVLMGIGYAGLKFYGIRKKTKDIHGDVI